MQLQATLDSATQLLPLLQGSECPTQKLTSIHRTVALAAKVG
jgi:hypothetical protein